MDRGDVDAKVDAGAEREGVARGGRSSIGMVVDGR
jgi:hypothetical protein